MADPAIGAEGRVIELRGYQERAVRAALAYDGFALFPEPRTGKTYVALTIVKHRKPRCCVIICPKQATRVWKEHLGEMFPAQLEIAFWLMSYGEFVSMRHRMYTWARENEHHRDFMLILDESHYIKARGSKRSMAIRHFAKYIRYKLILTGTPIANGLQDAWAQFDLIDPEIFGDWNAFDRQYLVWGGFKKKRITGYLNREDFMEKLHSRSFRITLREARMEPDEQGKVRPLTVRRSKRYVELNPATWALYRAMEEELEAEVNRVRVKVVNVMACCMKLQQMTGGCLLPASGMPLPVGSEKLEALAHLIGEELRRKKFIVVCRFLFEIDRITKLLKGACGKTVKVVKGGEPFDGHFDTDAVVLQVQSGIAVDMSDAYATVFFSTDYSFLNYEQALFRILDYNKRQATFYYLLARGTIDEDIYEAVTGKKRLADVVCDKYRRNRSIAR